jgi:hypothetical protein
MRWGVFNPFFFAFAGFVWGWSEAGIEYLCGGGQAMPAVNSGVLVREPSCCVTLEERCDVAKGYGTY